MLFRNLALLRRYSTSMTSNGADEVLFDIRNNVGIITLNRPRVLNSLNTNMVKMIYSKLKEWERKCSMVIIQGVGDKAFCAGGDVVFATRDKEAGKDFVRNEYKMNYLIGTYKLPYISICDGITMGGGVGISVHGSYRIATEKTLFAMPEATIGLFPDVGGSHFLSRLPSNLGYLFGMSCYRLQGVDVAKVGIATHYLLSKDVPNLIDKLINVDPDRVGEFLDESTVDISARKFCLSNYIGIIEPCFAAPSVELILHELWRDGSDWSQSVAEAIQVQSPTSLKIIKKQLQLGAYLDLKECLQMEYRLTCAALDKKVSPDLYEGIRALLIDKDKSPKWDPDHLEKVTDEMVNECFARLPESEELVL